MPRTFDWQHEDNHFGGTYSHLSEKEYRLKVREICAGIRHHVIPPAMQDILYGVATSSMWMGHRKQGQAQHCAHAERVPQVRAPCRAVMTRTSANRLSFLIDVLVQVTKSVAADPHLTGVRPCVSRCHSTLIAFFLAH